MSTHISTARVSELNDIIKNPNRGVIGLLGDHGGLSLITGDIEESSVFGAITVITEHGTLYLDPEASVSISEEFHPSILQEN